MMLDTDLSYYGLRVSDYGNSRDNTGVERTEIVLQNVGTNIGSNAVRDKEFARDMELMNKIRLSSDPSVKDAFEGMLTMMALSSGRDYHGTVASERASK